ncbi:DNA-binding transcriptional MerR regulator [Rhodanobacter sp. ANJX3]|jgi:DNA-binding transcriptional MerR regulator|uniref:helix-turn-helix domain-containing protein n=1 Tax=unclassified Rhodanobacter TaxID=2621553 RepID=UPI0015CC5DFA|nr:MULTISPECIES: MerR family transcriptional regulator [unclassified Rhodanobacter]MBB5357635.1 DNA-binding transcriptional MerR regulator [Rhodanobacter sp. ANJX3]NYE27635.1 DNA-binding transcriptional MerR regulator [Rhodanobacter sp. K2T2]
MLIAEFCRRAELTRDAVRLYVKLGLFAPHVGHSASNRYQQFNEADLDRAAVIRTAQQLGFTLKQIVTFNREYEAGAMDRERKLAIMRDQLEAVDLKAERIRAMRKYLRAKIAWLEAGERGDEPVFCRMRR